MKPWLLGCALSLLLVSRAAFASVGLVDAFERPNLLRGDTPSGAWDTLDIRDATATLALSSAAARTGMWGLRLVDVTTATGQNQIISVSRLDSGGGATQYLRVWYRMTDVVSAADIAVVQINASGTPIATIADVWWTSTNALHFNCLDRVGGTPSTAQVASTPGAWHVLEVLLTNIGTGAGTCTGWQDGAQVVAGTGIDWTGVGLKDATLGAPYGQRSFRGTVDFDDALLAADRPSQFITLVAPATAEAGSCVTAQVGLVDGAGNPSLASSGLVVAVESRGVALTLSDAADCSVAISSITVPAGASQTALFIRGTTVGSASLSAIHPTSGAAASAIAISAPPDPPALPDPLTPGVDSPERGRLAVGCGCQFGGSSFAWTVALVAWAVGRRRRRVG